MCVCILVAIIIAACIVAVVVKPNVVVNVFVVDDVIVIVEEGTSFNELQAYTAHITLQVSSLYSKVQLFCSLLYLCQNSKVNNTYSKFNFLKISVDREWPPTSHVLQFKQGNMWNTAIFLCHVKITRLHRFRSPWHSIQIQSKITWK